MQVELTREQIWAVVEAIKQSAPKGDIGRLEEGSPLRKAYFRLVGQITDNA